MHVFKWDVECVIKHVFLEIFIRVRIESVINLFHMGNIFFVMFQSCPVS